MIDFIEHQSDMIMLAKGQCSLIQIKTSPQGNQTFDLPDSLRRTSGPNKARKDSDLVRRRGEPLSFKKDPTLCGHLTLPFPRLRGCQ